MLDYNKLITNQKIPALFFLKKKILVLFYRVQQEYNLLVEWNSSAPVSIG